MKRRDCRGGQMEEIAVVLNRFGDEQSTLLDQFERLSFEVRLNQAILGRSLSEPSTVRPRPSQAIVRDAAPQEGGRRRPGIRKVLKRLLKPFLLGGRRSKGKVKKGMAAADYSKGNPSPNPNPVPVYSKALSRSLRF